MSRAAIVPTLLSVGATAATPGGTVIAPEDGASIANANDGAHLILRVVSTSESERAVTVKGGESPPALRAGLGDLILKVPPAGDVTFLLEASRHTQADGSIDLDFSEEMTGKVSALKVPRGAS